MENLIFNHFFPYQVIQNSNNAKQAIVLAFSLNQGFTMHHTFPILFHNKMRKKIMEGIENATKNRFSLLGKQKKEKQDFIPDEERKRDKVSNAFSSIGLKMVQKLTKEMEAVCNDGKIIASLLFSELVRKGYQKLQTDTDPHEFVKGIEHALSIALRELDKQTIAINTIEQLDKIITAAACNDREIGQCILKAMNWVGKENTILIEEGKSDQHKIEEIEGISYNTGAISHSFFPQEKSQDRIQLLNPNILLVNKILCSSQEILPLLQNVQQSGSCFLLCVKDIVADAHATLILNCAQKPLKVIVIKMTSLGSQWKEIMEDLASFTGGVCGKTIESSTVGHCEQVVIMPNSTTLLNGKGSQKEIEERLRIIDEQLITSDETTQRDLKKRKNQLQGRIAIIRVGGKDEKQRKQHCLVFNKVLHTLQLFLEQGIVLGGGTSLFHAKTEIEKTIETLSGGEKRGARVFSSACESILKQIIINGGGDPNLEIIKIKERGSAFGFNLLSKGVVNCWETSIFDSVKTIKQALSSAVSFANRTLLSEAIVSYTDHLSKKSIR